MEITQIIENPSNRKPIFVYGNNEMISIAIQGTNKCLYIDLKRQVAFIDKPYKVNNTSH